MAYSEVGTVNIALSRIGAKQIANLSEDSPNAIAANLVWELIRNEVLESSDWRFAKTRVALAQNATTPVSYYDYAYTLPADFLRVARDNKDDPALYPNGAVSATNVSGVLEVQGTKYNYVIETILDGTLCLFTDYDNTTDDLFLTYIRKEVNPGRWSAHFVTAVSFRLAAELALIITESQKKFESMMILYESALTRAEGVNMSGDSVTDETGSTAWEYAGR